MVRVPADLKPLLDVAKKNGYKIVPSGRSKHMKVISPKGQQVVDDNGPLIVSGTPGDFRARDMHVKRFIGAGVIKPEQDPWREDKAKVRTDGKPETIDEEKTRREAARLEGLANMNRDRAERTRKIRARWEPIIARIGGWEKRGTVADAGQILHHYTKTRGREEAPASVSSAQQLVMRLRRGDTLSAKGAICFELLLDDLEHQPATLVERWHDLLREAKGLPPQKRTIGGTVGPPRPPAGSNNGDEENEVPYPGLSVIERRQDAKVFGAPAPRLALEALAEMVRGQSVERDTGELVDLAHKILEMELRR
jgi:hypothetical protein